MKTCPRGKETGRFVPADICERFWSRVRLYGSCWRLAGAQMPDGRPQVHWRGRLWLGHRIAYMIGHGRVPRKDEKVCHTCDVPWCVNPAHLFIGSQRDNMADASRKGRLGRVGFELADEIRRAYLRGEGASRDLAGRFGLSSGTVLAIINGKIWVKDDELAERCRNAPKPKPTKLLAAVARLREELEKP